MKNSIILIFLILSTLQLEATGTIILLHGTGSAGKSSISKILQKKLFDAVAVSVDDFLWPVLLQNSLEKRYTKKEMTKQEQEQIVMNNIAKLSINNDQMKTLLQKLYQHAKNVSNHHAYVILDTVFLRYQDYQWFCNATQDISVISVLVYCSPINLAQHVMKRNSGSNIKEQRNITSHLKNFTKLYKKSTDDTRTIDTLTEKNIQKTLSIIQTYLFKIGTRKSKIKEQITKLQDQYFTNFFRKEHQVEIKYEFPYDMMVNTGELSSIQCADMIYKKLTNNV
ncbi:AAA family ATPase [Candidatus Babeliales bacterium]|nr:AAA family ATPase [Candidatus Babeliales bacterium]